MHVHSNTRDDSGKIQVPTQLVRLTFIIITTNSEWFYKGLQACRFNLLLVTRNNGRTETENPAIPIEAKDKRMDQQQIYPTDTACS
jgi:hypothetical protein